MVRKKRYRINFRDSYLLIPSSLKDLCKNFKIIESKDIFPHKFVKPQNIKYEGPVPPIETFYNVTSDEYNNYVSRFPDQKWNIIIELDNYCKQDCISLYKVIETFSKLIMSEFISDSNSSVTLSSLAINIFRTKFIPKNVKIPAITGFIFQDIIKSFTGGAVDIYKPYGENVTRVDVNSLYPYVIISCEYPVGEPIQFIGDYMKLPNFKDKLAIVEAEIETPLDLKHPVLIIRNENGINIRPLGKWKGWYTNKELENSAKFGYKYKIKRGYLFDIKVDPLKNM